LLTWSFGAACIVTNIFTYSMYVETPTRTLGLVSFTFLMIGFAVIYGAAYQFRTGRSPVMRSFIGSAVALIAVLPPMATGYTGPSFILFNLAAAILMAGCANEYWKGRAEAPVPMIGLTVLYAITGLSFILCSTVLLVDFKWILGGAPRNWAEDLSLVVVIGCMTGIGALSLSLNHWRIASKHRLEAMTDPLTGILNRRALFDGYEKHVLEPSTAVLVFDLDNFKTINDRFGHSAGDAVLKTFALELELNCGTAGSCARLGGEEFALILTDCLPERAVRIAENIRKDFAERLIPFRELNLQCTVSVGVAFGLRSGSTLESVLVAADRALYNSKDGGRNRVSVSTYLHAVQA
jgi:diguanylate cyclase (GGDEF)-like protein